MTSICANRCWRPHCSRLWTQSSCCRLFARLVRRRCVVLIPAGGDPLRTRHARGRGVRVIFGVARIGRTLASRTRHRHVSHVCTRSRPRRVQGVSRRHLVARARRRRGFLSPNLGPGSRRARDARRDRVLSNRGYHDPFLAYNGLTISSRSSRSSRSRASRRSSRRGGLDISSPPSSITSWRAACTRSATSWCRCISSKRSAAEDRLGRPWLRRFRSPRSERRCWRPQPVSGFACTVDSASSPCIPTRSRTSSR